MRSEPQGRSDLCQQLPLRKNTCVSDSLEWYFFQEGVKYAIYLEQTLGGTKEVATRKSKFWKELCPIILYFSRSCNIRAFMPNPGITTENLEH